MSVLGVRINGTEYSWEEAFREASQNPLRPWSYTPDVLSLIQGDNEPGPEAFSPSRLLDCDRKARLLTELGGDYYIDVDSSWPLVRGNMVHALMERSAYPGSLSVIREQRFYVPVNTAYGEQQLTAKPDLVVIRRIDGPEFRTSAVGGKVELPSVIHIKVVDYKSKTKIEHSLTAASEEHQLQVNIYAYIMAKALPAFIGMPEAQVVVDELEIDYVDMSRFRRFTSAGWLQDRGKRLTLRPLSYETLELEPIVLYPLEWVEQYVTRRIEERVQSLTSRELPPVLPEEDRWRCINCPVRAICERRS